MTIISDTLVTPALSQRPAGGADLSQIAATAAAEPARWRHLLRFDPLRRCYSRLELTAEYEVWLLSWQPGQGTGFHDHGGSRGAFAIALGELEERTVRHDGEVTARTVATGQVRSFGARFIHHVGNASAGPAVSVHAYSPPLPPARRYELAAGGLRYVGTEPAEVSG